MEDENFEDEFLTEEALLDAEAEERVRVQNMMDALGSTLQKQADEQVTLKNTIEERWLEDLEQYSGQYDASTKAAIKTRKGSQVFVNITRHKSNAAEARLSEMLFPTDDKNWGIQPTPVPVLDKLRTEGQVVPDQNGQPVDTAAEADKIIAKAREASKLMEREIDDQLNECSYNAEARDVIHDAVVMGIGIIKGPVVEGRSVKAWRRTEGGQKLKVEQLLTPCARRVSPWNFFPDMTAVRLAESAFTFERHHFTKSEMADLTHIGFDEDAIREAISSDKGSRRDTSDSYLTRLRAINGYTSDVSNDNRYEVWEYHGSVSSEVLEASGVEFDEDSLYELTGSIWFIDGKILKVNLNPMDTAEKPYSTFCFEEDDTSIFGVGVPYLMRNAQAVINSSWRMIMDNAGLSSGPQIIVNKQLVTPADGDWTMTPRKIWHMKDKTRSVHDVFGSHEISSHQAELANIFQVAKQIADDETSVPLVVQGESSNHAQTATGMSLLNNNANIILRRNIKVWDDNVTRPLLQRFYDWNMQFSEKDEIKGDFKIDARGSTALMEKEIQMQNMAGIMQISQSPAFAPITKFPELYRMALKHLHIPTGDVVMTDDEIKEAQEARAKQPQQPEDPIAAATLEFKKQQQKDSNQHKQMDQQIKQKQLAIEEMRSKLDYESTMAKLASNENLTMKEFELKMGLKQMDLASAEKLMAFETQVKQAYGTGL